MWNINVVVWFVAVLVSIAPNVHPALPTNSSGNFIVAIDEVGKQLLKAIGNNSTIEIEEYGDKEFDDNLSSDIENNTERKVQSKSDSIPNNGKQNNDAAKDSAKNNYSNVNLRKFAKQNSVNSSTIVNQKRDADKKSSVKDETLVVNSALMYPKKEKNLDDDLTLNEDDDFDEPTKSSITGTPGKPTITKQNMTPHKANKSVKHKHSMSVHNKSKYLQSKNREGTSDILQIKKKHQHNSPTSSIKNKMAISNIESPSNITTKSASPSNITTKSASPSNITTKTFYNPVYTNNRPMTAFYHLPADYRFQNVSQATQHSTLKLHKTNSSNQKSNQLRRKPSTYVIISNEQKSKPIENKGKGSMNHKVVKAKDRSTAVINLHNLNHTSVNKPTNRSHLNGKDKVVDETKIAMKLGTGKKPNKNEVKPIKKPTTQSSKKKKSKDKKPTTDRKMQSKSTSKKPTKSGHKKPTKPQKDNTGKSKKEQKINNRVGPKMDDDDYKVTNPKDKKNKNTRKSKKDNEERSAKNENSPHKVNKVNDESDSQPGVVSIKKPKEGKVKGHDQFNGENEKDNSGDEDDTEEVIEDDDSEDEEPEENSGEEKDTPGSETEEDNSRGGMDMSEHGPSGVLKAKKPLKNHNPKEGNDVEKGKLKIKKINASGKGKANSTADNNEETPPGVLKIKQPPKHSGKGKNKNGHHGESKIDENKNEKGNNNETTSTTTTTTKTTATSEKNEEDTTSKETSTTADAAPSSEKPTDKMNDEDDTGIKPTSFPTEKERENDGDTTNKPTATTTNGSSTEKEKQKQQDTTSKLTPTDTPTDSTKMKDNEKAEDTTTPKPTTTTAKPTTTTPKPTTTTKQQKEKVKKEDSEKEVQTNENSDIKDRKQDDSAADMFNLLSKLRFMNGASGKVTKDQQFSYISQCGLYTEPQNVSLVQHSWVTKTYSPYFYLYEKPKNYEQCKPSEWLHEKEMRGSVFLSFEVKSLRGSNMTNNAKICEKYCCKEPRCQAWTLRFQESSTSNCPENSFCCWLKNAVPPVEDHEACISGVVHRKNYKHPPTGMRSAVPLGGLGAGSFEMRADGTFHEWTIENQSPGGSAKLGKTALEKFFLGARVSRRKLQTDKDGEQKIRDEKNKKNKEEEATKYNAQDEKRNSRDAIDKTEENSATEANTVAAILKTHVPNGFGNDSVDAMEYFGAHPVSKFKIDLHESLKGKLDLELYAFSSFHPREEAESATPAVAFSLSIGNPNKDEELDVSFMMNLPFGYNEDTIRKGNNYQEKQFSRLVTPSDCQRACAERDDCQAWTTNGPYTCMLKDNIPLHSYDYGIISGIKGNWTVQDGMLNCKRPGSAPQSGSITMYPVNSGSELMSYTVSDDLHAVWKTFKESGHVKNNSESNKVNSTGLNGAVSVSTKLKPKEKKVLTILFAWYFPNRDISDERVGNFYANLFKSSKEVAEHFRNDLNETLKNIVKWQSVIFPPQNLKSDEPNNETEVQERTLLHPTLNCTHTVNGINTLPTCLQDIMVNSLSFLRTGMWMEDGRWRQWEAFDCSNLDPVHIDFHRVLPYVIFYPELIKQVMFSWANHQLANTENGMIQESLSVGCLEETSREGVAGGRLMADVNVAFIAQAYLIYSWTNDTDFFNTIYPYTVRAAHWLIKRSTKNTELPFRKADTYDLFELDKYDHCAYNSILYFLALHTMKKMAGLKKDSKTLYDVTKALKSGEERFDVEFWDEKKGFYHAWFDDEWGSPSWLMTDILYGQVWSYTLGLGDLVDQDKMKQHLKVEKERNDSPFGLKVITKSEEPYEIEDTSVILGEEINSCKSLENITKTNSIWMSSSTDWSTLQLYLGLEPSKAMRQSIKSLDNYRSNLRDQWNFHGITSSNRYGLDGLPWATSHYTLHLVLWHLPIALSGQQYYAPNGTLKFEPKYSPPYWLPFYTPQCMGNIEAKEMKGEKTVEILYTIKISSGNCRLNELSISGVKYSEPIELNTGDELSWSTPKVTKKELIKSILEQLKH